MVGEKIGRFEIEREVVSTSSGAVYKATDSKSGRTVALRTLASAALGAADASAAHARNVHLAMEQARAASALNSINVASIYGGGETQGIFFVTMEWVEGLSLRAMLRDRHQFGARELADIARQVCQALDHAHARGVFHHRLTPNNIVVGWDGTVKVTDFEIAQPSGSKRALPYLAPEQIAAQAPDARSNLFSFAAILCELAGGQRAFPGDDVEEIARRVYHEPPALAEDMKPELAPVLRKALAKPPAERYQSGAELMADLEPALWRAPAPAPVPREQRTAKLAASLAEAQAARRAAAAARAGVNSAPAFAPPPESTAPAPEPRPLPKEQKEQTEKKRAVLWGMPWLPARPLAYGAGLCLLLTVMVSATVLYPRMKTAAAEAAPAAEEPPAALLPELEVTPLEPVVTRPVPRPRRSSRPAAPAEAAPPAPQPMGELIIESSPGGAQVEIEGHAALGGRTPLQVAALAPGSYTVRLARAGYEPQTRQVTVTAEQKSLLVVALAALPAQVSVSSQPAGARILVDGKDTGQSTPAQVTLPHGAYTLALHKAGFLAESRALSLAPGELSSYSASLAATGSTEKIRRVGRLSRAFGTAEGPRLQVKTDPKGAQVAINGQAMPGATPAEFTLEPGTYQVRLTAPGRKPVEKLVTVPAGGRVVLEEALEQ